MRLVRTDFAGSVHLVHRYAPLNVTVRTPRLELHGATDQRLDELGPLVHAGRANAEPAPYDDPISLYEPDPDVRVAKWLQGIWRGRGNVSPESWRLYFVVLLEGRAVGMQDLIGHEFATHGTVMSFSWLSSDARRRGMGTEMRHAVLHLAFEGFGATEAASEAFTDNTGSNGVSRALGYEPNGTTWSTRRGERAPMHRWRLTRQAWQERRRQDITLSGVEACRRTLGV